jgi:hypothetical protein
MKWCVFDFLLILDGATEKVSQAQDLKHFINELIS